jgi:hypothetical protein
MYKSIFNFLFMERLNINNAQQQQFGQIFWGDKLIFSLESRTTHNLSSPVCLSFLLYCSCSILHSVFQSLKVWYALYF